MKHRFFVLFAVIILGLISVSAQDKNYEIEITMAETIVSNEADEIPVAVKIRNYGKETLRTAGLGDIFFFFSKCEAGVVCDKTGDKFAASLRMPSKSIRENSTFEFSANLADLFWKDETDSGLTSGGAANFGVIPPQNNNFYAGIRTLEGYRPIANSTGNSGPKRPVYSYKFSNGISVTIKD
ncbi:MAG: hypothetical protein R2681_09075 [Pyrinomonadaceae bacterium]